MIIDVLETLKNELITVIGNEKISFTTKIQYPKTNKFSKYRKCEVTKTDEYQ